MTKKFEKQINEFLSKINIKYAVLSTFNYIQNELRKLNLNTQNGLKNGRTIGSLFEQILIEYLNDYELTFINGNEKSEKDCICLEIPQLSFEIKTSSTSNYPVGSKTNKGNVNKGIKYNNNSNYSFMVFCKYSFNDDEKEINIIPERIYVGMYKPSDFKSSKSEGSGSARIPSNIFNNQFIQIY